MWGNMNKGERKREAASHDNEMLDSLLSLSNQAYCTEDSKHRISLPDRSFCSLLSWTMITQTVDPRVPTRPASLAHMIHASTLALSPSRPTL